MSDKANDFNDLPRVFTQWASAMTKFWDTTSDPKDPSSRGAAACDDPPANPFTFPGNSLGLAPGIFTRLAQAGLDDLFRQMDAMSARVGRSEKERPGFQAGDLGENLSRVWGEVYEKELRKFFHVPQLGLTRTYQERAGEAFDKFNIFQATLAEFLQVLCAPFPRSAAMMQEKLWEMAETGDLPEEPQSYYRMWIKVLEGGYMTLYQTPEYTELLARTLNALARFRNARDAVLEDMLSPLPIPKRKEVDDLEEEVFALRKELTALKRSLA